MRQTIFLTIITTFILMLGASVFGQVNISNGTTITEDFDSLGTSATATLPTGFKADKFTTARTLGTFAAAGTATEQRGGNSLSSTAANGIYNFGAGDPTTATDRAVGFLSSGSATKSGNLYLQLLNNGTTNIGSFNISYDVEKYRNGSNTAGFTIQLYYSTDGSTWTSAGSTFTTTFPADADTNGFASAPGTTIAVTGSIPITIPVNGNFYLAWDYSVTSGTTTSNAQALAIDNVSITAAPPTPAPASIGGRVTDIYGRPIAGAFITVTGGDLLVPVRVFSDQRGFYTLEGLTAGGAYIVEVKSKFHDFDNPTRFVDLSQSVVGLDFVGRR